MVNDALACLDGEFDAIYIDFGRPAIPPERLINASLNQILFSVRCKRQLMEQMQHNLLFRWFVGLGIDDPVGVRTMTTQSREQLLKTKISRKILAHRRFVPPLSDDHFMDDSTLMTAWTSMTSFQPKAADTPPDIGARGPPGPDSPAEDNRDAPPRPPAPQCRGRPPGREAVQRDGCLDH